MTVSTTTSRIDYTGNNVTTSFAVPFPFIEAAYLRVLRTTIATGVETVLTLNSDYTVTVSDDGQTGTVDTTVAPTSAQRLSIIRNVPATQEADFVANDPLPAETIEDALDKLTMLVNDGATNDDRAILIPEGAVNFDNVLPPAVANQLIAVNGTADGLEYIDPSSIATISTTFSQGAAGAETITINDKLRQFISLADFGGAMDGVSNDSPELEAACAAAAARGNKRVIITGPSVLLSTPVDAQGCIIDCCNTSISGEIENHGGIVGAAIEGFRQDLLLNHLTEPVASSPKLLYRQDADRYLVMTRKPGRKNAGVIFELIKGITTLSNSLGVNAEFLRCGWVYNCTGIYSYRKTATSTTGTWSSYNVPASALGHASDNQMRQATANEGTAGSTITWSIVVPRDGRVNVAVMGASSTRSFDINVDGVTVGTYDAGDWPSLVRVIEFQAPPGTRSIQIDNTSAGAQRILGVNFTSIDEAIPGASVDEWSVYRDVNFPYYVENQGAHDYAIYEVNAGLWGGSFHGGETALTAQFIYDGVVDALPVMGDGGLICRGDIALRQRTLIDWSADGGGTIRTESYHLFRDGQVQLDVAFTPMDGLEADRFYTAMHGAHEDFDRIIFPIEDAIVLDGGDVPFGQCNRVGLRHTTSGAISITEFTLFKDHEGIYGGARLEPIAGSYNKIYYGPVVKGARVMGNISATTKRTFR